MPNQNSPIYKVLAYLSPFIVLVAALVALLGESRLDGVSGLGGLTGLGWASATLAILSTAIVLVTVNKSHRELAEARRSKARIHAVAHQSIQRGLDHLKQVLKFACLIRYVASPYHAREEPRKVPYEHVERGGMLLGYNVDLRSQEALEDLRVFYLHPSIKLAGPYLPSIIPFGTDIVRPILTILTDESTTAKQRIEGALQMYSATSLSPEVYEATSKLLESPFLEHLTDLSQFWLKRYRMEHDCNVPEITMVSVIDSGHTGGYERDYLALLDSIDALETAMQESSPPKID